MCHPELASGRSVLLAAHEAIDVTLSGGERMPVELVAPDPAALPADADAPAPTVIVVADIFGPSDFYRDLCARLSANGLQAVMPDYFFRQGPLEERTFELAAARRAELDEAGTLEDIRALIEWVRERAAEPEHPVGILGFCMGGTLALDLAALEREVVIVAYYGFPVPQATIVSPPPAPLELASRMQGSILAFWGDEDSAVGRENVERFVEAMRSSSANFEPHVYAGLGHGFLAQASLDEDPDAADDASRSWALTLEHFHRHLQDEDPG
jgi:carboxymethylenebutenolidase